MIKRQLVRFLKDAEGAVIAFVLVIFLVMVLAAGMATDFMRHEVARADLQNALDRGVLAATDADQTVIPTIEAQLADGDGDLRNEYEALIASYMSSNSFVRENPQLIVQPPDPTSNVRRIQAAASFELPTYFLRIAGITSLTVNAASAAIDGQTDLEIALVFDVSESMNFRVDTDGDGSTFNDANQNGNRDAFEEWDPDDQRRIELLRASAINFVNRLLDEDPNSAVNQRTAISIIPFNGEVNPGSLIASAYENLDEHHTRSYCFDFHDGDFNSLALPISGNARRIQHFPFPGQIGEHWCPANEDNERNRILAYSNDRAAIADYINSFDPYGWTASYSGMKWAAALLDPTAEPLVDYLINQTASAGPGEYQVPSVFSGWPSDYSNQRAQKVVILVSDGRNTVRFRMDDDEYAPTEFVVGDRTVPRDIFFNDFRCWISDFFDPVTQTCSDAAGNPFARADTTDGPFYREVDNVADGTLFTNSDGLTYSLGPGDDRTRRLCRLLKDPLNTIPDNAAQNGYDGQDQDNGVLIYTIGVELSGSDLAAVSAREALRQCTTNPAVTHFESTADNLDAPFDAIATTLIGLRLTPVDYDLPNSMNGL